MPNLFAKLKKTHLYQDPIEHIYASNIFDIKEYDKLYENQNNPNHKVWKDFQTTYNFKKIRFFNDLNNVELDETMESKKQTAMYELEEMRNEIMPITRGVKYEGDNDC